MTYETLTIIVEKFKKGEILMRKDSNSFYVLQVSDFHITEDSRESAENALNALKSTLKEMNIRISYLIHTGDIINSRDLEEKIKEKYGEELIEDEYDDYLDQIVSKRLDIAKKIITDFVKDLDIVQKNIVICCGNHDKVRYRKKKEAAFEQFENFLGQVCSHKELTALHKLDDLNVLVLNTNISDNKKVTCVDCTNLKRVLNLDSSKEESMNWFYTYNKNVKITSENKKVNIIVAHQPLYDICEHIRLPYESETQTTDFLSALQDFINGNGIYLCGDKHTSSIAATYIHDIPHYFCGHPFVFEETKLPNGCMHEKFPKPQSVEIDYNLIEIKDGKTGQVRKLHLSQKNYGPWECQIHPIDAVVSNLYEKSRSYIVRNSFALLAMQSGTRYSSWANLSWRNLFNRLDTIIKSKDLEKISEFYSLFCRLKNDLGDAIEWDCSTNIFYKLSQIISGFFEENDSPYVQNIINIRGDYSSSKSTFLGVLYIYLLYRYSYGEINYIPAYFNMENDDILKKIQDGSTYSVAVKQIFSSFVNSTEKIAEIEHVPVCYIVDGLDEQDIWSESSQDSIGRVALDILAETSNSKYIMSFCQNKLARFKNTMSAIKYYEKSYVMYFNSISVKERGSESTSFVKFVKYIIDSSGGEKEQKEKSVFSANIENENVLCEPKECSIIRKLRRLSINPGFIYHNYPYLKECKNDDSINTVYTRYIDQQHQICLDALEYNFVHYAPAMAYLFTYEGYTYERFKAIAPSTSNYWEKKIVEHSNRIYKTFIFIKKHKDAREYLLALHYNRELRYFAENPKIEIPENSIINKLISRNVSIIIKKIWRSDQNKFVIVCQNLIEKRRLAGSKQISYCTLSMLIYILAYLDKIPDYIREEVKEILLNVDNNGRKDLTEGRNNTMLSDANPWKISGDNSEKMRKFIDLSYLHSKKILSSINTNNSFTIVRELLKLPEFKLYNRQYMMWYYGDLTIYGENRINNLVPGENVINKGIDYYNCFYTLHQKIYDYLESDYTSSYPLLEFDLFTIWDLAYSRQVSKKKVNTENIFEGGFFCSEDEKEREVFVRIKEVLEKYITNYYKIHRNIRVKEEEGDWLLDYSNYSTKTINRPFETIVEKLESQEIENAERYVYCFFRLIKRLFPEFK